jgi:hypothetical protein
MDSDEAEPMRAEVFDIAVSALSFHGAGRETPRIVLAARAVLVEGMRPGEAATQFDFPPERVSEAVGRIRDKWAAICNERGLVTETFSLSPILIELIRQIELEALQPLQADAAGKRRKKAADAPAGTSSTLPSKKGAPAKLPPQKIAEKKPAKYKKPAVAPSTTLSTTRTAPKPKK